MSKEKLLASAQKYLQKNQLSRAIKDYRKLAGMDPKDLRIQQKLAELHSRSGDSEEANRIYQKVATNYAGNGFTLKAIAVYKQMQKLDPDQEEVYHRLAELNAKQGLVGNALAEYRSLIEYLERRDRLNEVADILQKMKEIDPENLNLRVKICEIQARGGDLETAGKEILDITSQLIKKDDLNKAIKLFEMFIPFFPSAPDLKAGLGEALIRKGETDQGLRLLEELARDYPENPRIRQLLEHGPHLADPNEKPADAQSEFSAARADVPGSDVKPAIPEFSSESSSEPEEGISDSDSYRNEETGMLSRSPECGDMEGEEEIPLEFLEGISSDDDADFSSSGTEVRESQALEGSGEEAFDFELGPDEIEDEISSTETDGLSGDHAADSQSSDTNFFSEEVELELELELDEDGNLGEGEGDLLDLDQVLEDEERDDISPAAAIEEAEFYLAQGLADEAERLGRSLLEKEPRSEALLSLMARIEDVRGNSAPPAAVPESSGEEDFGDFLEEVEESTGFRIPEMGEKDRRMLDGALADFRKGVEDQVDGEDTETHYNLGIAYKEMGLLEDAVAEFDRAMRDPARRIDCLTLKGLCLAESGAFKKAEDVLKEGLTIEGLTSDNRNGLLFELGDLYERTGRSADAVKSYQSVIASDPFFRDVGSRMEKLRHGQEEDTSKSGKKGRRDKISYI